MTGGKNCSTSLASLYIAPVKIMFPKHDQIGFVMAGKNFFLLFFFFFFFFFDVPASTASTSSSFSRNSASFTASKQSFNSNSNRSAFVSQFKSFGSGTKSSWSSCVFSCALPKNGRTQANTAREIREAVSRFAGDDVVRPDGDAQSSSPSIS